MIVAVAAAAGSLEIIALRGLYAAKPRAAALYVYNQRRQIAACQVRDSLAF